MGLRQYVFVFCGFVSSSECVFLFAILHVCAFVSHL